MALPNDLSACIMGRTLANQRARVAADDFIEITLTKVGDPIIVANPYAAKVLTSRKENHESRHGMFAEPIR